MTILPMELADTAGLAVLQPEGWGDIVEPFRYNVASPLCQPLKAVIDGAIAGVGTSILNGSTAWLAQIIVHPQYRGRGIGTAITKALIDGLDNSIYKTILLDATDAGYAVYCKLGFKVIAEHYHFTGTRYNGPLHRPDAVLPLVPAYREDVLALDSLASGEDRSAILLEHMAASVLYMADGRVAGAYFPGLHKGLVIAHDARAGIELMKLRLMEKDSCMVPSGNSAVSTFLQSIGYTLVSTSRRMSLGADINWRPDMIYNVTGGARG